MSTNPIPAREYEPGYNADTEFQGWMNSLRTKRTKANTNRAEVRNLLAEKQPELSAAIDQAVDEL